MSMSPFLAVSFFLLFCSAAAFNITKILNEHPDFSTFNNYLSQTHLADEINGRQTITVLAVDNGAISALSGKGEEVIKRIMTVQIVLDYYDMEKLKKLSSNKSILLTTLFQSTGMATNQQGFINVTVSKSGGDIRLGSGVPGSGLTASFIKSVDAQPFNISVLQISNAVIPPGIENIVTKNAPPPPPKKAHTPTKAPTPTKSRSPAKSPSPASSSTSPAADGPASDEAGSPSPSDVADSGWAAARITLGTCLGVVIGLVCMVAL